MVTDVPARILRLRDAGRIEPGLPADLVVLPPRQSTPEEALVAAARRDVALVTMNGKPVVGCPSLSAVFVGRRTTAQPVAVDGMERLVSSRLAHAIARCPIREPGVECLS
jgi:cytosine/adenosine deaminase-related metal-dependent hydrolase